MSAISELSAQRREYLAPRERPSAPPPAANDSDAERASASEDDDATQADARVAAPTYGTDAEAKTTQDTKDATRSVQDLIAAALKMFSAPEPKAAPVATATPAIQMPAAPTIEAAVQQVLDQISATVATIAPKPPETSAKETTDDPEAKERGDALPDSAILVAPERQTQPTDAPLTAKGPVATTAVRDPAPLPENPNPSHVHLVIDDGAERVVVTVAVRGTEVNATIRGGDDQTAAAIARNAASLDHALRAGGLDLSSFTSERDLDHHAPREHAQRDQDSTDEELT